MSVGVFIPRPYRRLHLKNVGMNLTLDVGFQLKNLGMNLTLDVGFKCLDMSIGRFIRAYR